MSPKVSATYRIKLQIFLILNLAFKKAGPNRPGSTTRNPGLHRRPSQKSWKRAARGPSKSQDRREPIRSAWCWRPVRISLISPRAEFPRGAIWRRPRRWFAGPSACRRTPGPSAGGLGRARCVDRHRRDPAARGGNQIRRRLFARVDREGEGRGVFARAGADGAVARQGGESRARTQKGRVMGTRPNFASRRGPNAAGAFYDAHSPAALVRLTRNWSRFRW